MTFIRYCSISILLLLISACSSTPEKPDCVYADGSNQPAPKWICIKDSQLTALVTVTYADKSATGINFMRQAALVAAQDELLQLFKLRLKQRLTDYAQRQALIDSQLLAQVIAASHQQVTLQSLIGVRITRQRITPTGGLVIMVGINEEDAISMSQQTIKKAMLLAPSLWQKLQPKESLNGIFKRIFKLPEDSVDNQFGKGLN